MADAFVLPLNKAMPVEDSDGVLTERGMGILHLYARRWVNRRYRDVALERQFPELVGSFYDIRNDPEYAREHAQVVDGD